MDPAEGIQKFIEFIVLSLTHHPGKAGVVMEENEGEIHYLVHVADDEVSRIMGKENRGISAIRNLAVAAGEMHGLKVVVKLKGEELPQREFKKPRPPGGGGGFRKGGPPRRGPGPPRRDGPPKRK